MKKIFISIALTAVLCQFLGSVIAKSGGNSPQTAKLVHGKGVRYLPFFSYI